jgi:hypothetical protein
VCLPAGALWGTCCTEGGPETREVAFDPNLGICSGGPQCREELRDVRNIEFARTRVVWQELGEKGGAQRVELLEWRVAPEDAAGFAELRAAFEALGLAVPPP